MEKKIEVTYGYRVVDENNKTIGYETGSTFNGFCFKDTEAFEKHPNDICYIPEYGMEEINEELTNLQAIYENGGMSTKEYEEQIDFICRGEGWTFYNILNLVAGELSEEEMKVAEAGEGFGFLARIVFDTVDWQSPETYFMEMVLDDFFDELERHGLTKEILIEHGYEL